MVEGMNASLLAHTERMTSLTRPGCILLFVGIIMPVIAETVNLLSSLFTNREMDLFNGIFSIVMVLGLTFLAYGLTYQREGKILLPLVLCFLLLCSIDLISWVYFVWLNWVPVPPAIFILPYSPPGYIPVLLTLLFISLIVVARLSYYRDPRSFGRPRYNL